MSTVQQRFNALFGRNPDENEIHTFDNPVNIADEENVRNHGSSPRVVSPRSRVDPAVAMSGIPATPPT